MLITRGPLTRWHLKIPMTHALRTSQHFVVPSLRRKVLYEMTSLKHPFDADSLVNLASKILKERLTNKEDNKQQSQQIIAT